MSALPLIPQRLSLVSQTLDVLRDALRQGVWRERMPGERELSRQLNVSRPTLRSALAQLQREGLLQPSPGRQRVISRRPSAKVSKRALTIALLTPMPLREVPPFALCWMDKLRELLADSACRLEIHAGKRWYTRRPEKELTELTRQMPATAWVLFMASERMQQWFAAQKLPCMLAGSAHAGVDLPSVDFDYRAVCRHAAGQFLARGHRRAALLLQAPFAAGDFESEAGFREAFAQSANQAEPIIATHDGTPANIRRRLDELLRLKPAPTAFLVGRAMPALTVASELMRRGLRLPQDAVVISRDSDHFLEHFSPALARYVSDPEAHARRLARAALQLAQGSPGKTRAIRLMPEFLRGESLG